MPLPKSRVAAATVPPLVFVNLPKAGGTTLNHILMKNYRFRCDAYGPDFFPRYYPDEFVSLVQPPGYDDTKRPVFFTGHIDLANELLRYMPVRIRISQDVQNYLDLLIAKRPEMGAP